MKILEKKIYEYSLSQSELDALDVVVNMLYQFQNNPDAYAEVERRVKNKCLCLSDMTIPQMITILQEIGGEEYAQMVKKVRNIKK